MMMEKYGVSDRVELMKGELAKVKTELQQLRNSTEKTASTTSRIIDLRNREGELAAEISRQS